MVRHQSENVSVSHSAAARPCCRTLAGRAVSFLEHFTGEIRNLALSLARAAESRGPLLWLVMTGSLGFVVRFCFMTEPMRYDEAYTFLNFVNKSFADLFYYPLPNNHVFHTLMVRLSVAIFGSHPVWIRLPAFLAGMAVIPATFYLSRLLGGKRAGYLATALVAVFPFLVLYDTMARGYSLVTLLSLCLAILALRLVANPSLRLRFLISFVAALGMLTMPSFLFPAAGLFLWTTALFVFARYRFGYVLTKFILPCGVMTAAFTALLYVPSVIVSGGLQSILHNRFVTGLSWDGFLNRVPGHLSGTFSDMICSVPFLTIGVFVMLVAVGLVSAARGKDRQTLLLLPTLIVGAAAVFFIKHAIPFPRTWIFLLPFAFVVADIGYVRLYASQKKPVRTFLNSAIFVLACLAGGFIVSRNIIATYPDTGRFPEAAAVVDLLAEEMAPGDRVVVRGPANYPVFFYMWYEGVPSPDRAARPGSPAEFFIVPKKRRSLEGLTTKSARKLLEIEDAAVYLYDPSAE